VHEFRNTRKTGLIALSLAPEDELISVELTDGSEEIIIGTDEAILSAFMKRKYAPWGVRRAA